MTRNETEITNKLLEQSKDIARFIEAKKILHAWTKMCGCKLNMSEEEKAFDEMIIQELVLLEDKLREY